MQLTKEEKIAIIGQHIKNLENSKYNIELSIIEEGSISSPNLAALANLNDQIQVITTKISALNSEKTKLEA
jgi:hypothetical protein